MLITLRADVTRTRPEFIAGTRSDVLLRGRRRGSVEHGRDASERLLWRFGAFEFDAGTGELRRSGRRIHVAEQPARALRLLIEARGAIVTREALRHALWPGGIHVDFDQGVNSCIRQVRAVLDDRATTPRFIETLPRRGYRFVAPVERVDAEEATPEDGRPDASPAAVARRPEGATRHALPRIAMWMAPVVLLVGIVWVVTKEPALPDPPVLAVLPFENLGGAPDDDYLADGLTEELIAQLGRRHARELAVIARTSAMHYKGRPLPIPQIAEELGADYLLEGSVRREGDRVRVTAQLVTGDAASHLWASNYDRVAGDVLAVQTDLAARIADALALHLVPNTSSTAALAATLDPAEPVSGSVAPDAYDRYLRARHLARAPDYEQRVEGMRRLDDLLATDPTFAPAWVEWASLHRRVGGPPGETLADALAALRRAQSLDGEYARAWFVEGIVRLYGEFDVVRGRAAFEHALDLEPDFAEARHHYAAVHAIAGDHGRSLAEVRRALRLDPHSLAVRSDLCWYAYFARRYEEAIRDARATLEIEPRHFFSRRCELQSALMLGDVEAAAERVRADLALAGVSMNEDLETAIERGPDPEIVRLHWEELDRAFTEGPYRDLPDRTERALALVALGRHDEAVDVLERSFEGRAGWRLPFLEIDPWFDPLRERADFAELVARVRGAAR